MLFRSLGESELASGQVVVKNNQTREQLEVSLAELEADAVSLLAPILES